MKISVVRVLLPTKEKPVKLAIIVKPPNEIIVIGLTAYTSSSDFASWFEKGRWDEIIARRADLVLPAIVRAENGIAEWQRVVRTADEFREAMETALRIVSPR